MSVAAPTVVGLARDWAHKCPDRVWMKERSGDDRRQWTWQESLAQSDAVAAWLQAELGEKGTRIAILSRNRPHWFMADLAIAAAAFGGDVNHAVTTIREGVLEGILHEFVDQRTHRDGLFGRDGKIVGLDLQPDMRGRDFGQMPGQVGHVAAQIDDPAAIGPIQFLVQPGHRVDARLQRRKRLGRLAVTRPPCGQTDQRSQ